MDRALRHWLILLPLLAFPGFAGCTGSTATGTVNGIVTLDGQPLKEGVVRFVPADGKSPTASATVTGGKFTAAVSIGVMRVEFSAPKATGRRTKMYNTPDSPMVAEVAELIPDRFNVKSELRITVKKGSQDESFALKSK
jgi:hypothetical protein